jgi:acyl phosphate:glycerol-3-phosphate acyltransferase
MPPLVFWLAFNTALLLLAYLLGSLPTGYLVAKWLKGIDIREQGSGSTGATNVLRNLGKGPAIAVLLIDLLKGVAAITLVQWVYGSDLLAGLTRSCHSDCLPGLIASLDWQPWMTMAAGLAALIGHSKSIWLGFKGGKSVATSIGILLALSWQVALATIGVFAAVFAITRIVSISSILGAIAVPTLMLSFRQPVAYLLFGILGGIYVVWRHRSNIQRLLDGTEPKVGQGIPKQSNL